MKIKCAAILHDNKVYQGRTHAEIGWKMIDDIICDKPFPPAIFQGFVTDGDIFVDRELALHIAIKAKQVEEGETCHNKWLFSEDLIHSKIYNYPYQDKYIKKRDLKGSC